MKVATHIAPFLSEHVDLKVGLNQLGFRNASEELFTALLPGMNNVTARIRYYSFYCWLIREYYHRDKADKDTYRAFIRKSEYLLALIQAKLDDFGGIPGINYALAEVAKGTDTISLQDGVYNSEGKTNSGTYWANPGGVLQQYYVSSLRDMQILKAHLEDFSICNISKDDGFVCGERLADLFAESIGDEALNQFIHIVNRGSVFLNELSGLSKTFTMKSFIGAEDERDVLYDMLVQQDNPIKEISSCYRKGTIRYFLEFLDGTGNVSSLSQQYARFMYDKFHDGNDDPSVLGWYAYYLNDNWQYQVSRIFEQLLIVLKKEYGGRWISIDELVKKLTTGIVSVMMEGQSLTFGEALNKIPDIADSKKNEDICAAAIADLMLKYNENKSAVSRIGNMSILFPGLRSFDFFDLMEEWGNLYDKPFYDFLYDFIYSKVIYQHYSVSVRKYYQTGISSFKFIIENGNIRFLGYYEASHTSPRIETLAGFLQDLGLTEGMSLAEYGKEKLAALTV